jgi:hypothetical protein
MVMGKRTYQVNERQRQGELLLSLGALILHLVSLQMQYTHPMFSRNLDQLPPAVLVFPVPHSFYIRPYPNSVYFIIISSSITVDFIPIRGSAPQEVPSDIAFSNCSLVVLYGYVV